jgi:predicted nuclease with TOPRIM domain
MVLKSEMEKQNEALTKKVKRLENKVKKLKSKIEEADSEAAKMEEFRIDAHRRLYKETEDLRNKLFEREQQLDAQETKGPIFQVCDPSMQYVHKRRDMGVDVYVERHNSEEKFLLTRIPITFDYDVYHSMSFEERAAIVNPLVCGLRQFYHRSDEPIVHIESSINEMYWTEE